MGALSDGGWTPPKGAANGSEIASTPSKFPWRPSTPHPTPLDIIPQAPDDFANGQIVIQVVNTSQLPPNPFVQASRYFVGTSCDARSTLPRCRRSVGANRRDAPMIVDDPGASVSVM